MRVVYLVTCQKDVQCGVVDYTAQLAQAMTRQGDKAVIEELPTWSMRGLRRLYKSYGGDQKCIIHLQYPTMGMGKSPAPALLPFVFGSKCVFITLHEFQLFHLVRKLYFFAASLTATSFIFTNDYERGVFVRFFPWVKRRCIVVPIGNNIDVVADLPPTRNPPRVIYFGQITTNKGLEEFIETVRLLRARGENVACAIIGALMEAKGHIAQAVAKAAETYCIELKFNLSAHDVSVELQKSSIALLLFPQGVSDKRGSALACLKHGLALLTRFEKHTPSWWRETTYGVASPAEAASLVVDILAGRKARCPAPARIAESLAEREWSQIGKIHKELYKRAL